MKKKLLKLLLFCLFASALTTLKAQTNDLPASPASNYVNWGASLNLSTNGVGVELSRSFNNRFTARLGCNYLPLSIKNYQIDFSGTKLIANGDIKLGSISAYLDWHPFQNNFKVTGGVAYLLSSLNVIAYLKDSSKQGDITISPDQIGKISLDINPNSIAPYLGIGYGRNIPKTKFGVSIDLGIYYIGSPKVTFVTTKLLEPSTPQGKVLSDNMSGYQWLPKLSFSFNFKLNK
jgi:hypothetical protein